MNAMPKKGVWAICLTGVAALVTLGAVTASVSAATLDPGDIQFRKGYVPPGGTRYTPGFPEDYEKLIAEKTDTWSTTGFSGTVESKVYSDGSHLLFAYQVFNDTESKRSVTHLTIGDTTNPWLGWTISDAGAWLKRGDKGGHSTGAWKDGSPFFLLRESETQGAGLAVYWNYAGLGTRLKPGDYSSVFWFVTDAPSYRTTDVAILDGCASGQAVGLAPVPAPAVLVGILSLVPALAFVLRRWRRKTTR